MISQTTRQKIPTADRALIRAFNMALSRLPMFAFLLFASLMFSPWASLQAEEKGALSPMTLVELYTSQGCSSCPPADALVAELSRDEGVLALSFHVDYWDYIGWKDPYALKSSTARQRRYAETLGLRYVYTPQIIVNGKQEIIGSKRRALRQCLKDERLAASAPTQTNLHRQQDGRFILKASKQNMAYDLWHVVFAPSSKTRILRGENRGRTLSHTNSVRAIKHLGIWRGQSLQLSPPTGVAGEQALLIQERQHGPVIAAYHLQ